MRSYRTARLALVVAVLGLGLTFTPVAAQEPPIEPAAAAATAARIADATAPRSLTDFAGGWGRHGFILSISADGSAEASWRVYTWCKDNGNRQPCDSVQGNGIISGGKATFRFDRSDYRTILGTVLSSTDRERLPLGPVMLSEYDYGLGELVVGQAFYLAPEQRAMRDVVLLGGPRYESAPDWIRRTFPLGA